MDGTAPEPIDFEKLLEGEPPLVRQPEPLTELELECLFHALDQTVELNKHEPMIHALAISVRDKLKRILSV